MQRTTQTGQDLLACCTVVGHHGIKPLNRRDQRRLPSGKAALAHEFIQLDQRAFRQLKNDCGNLRVDNHTCTLCLQNSGHASRGALSISVHIVGCRQRSVKDWLRVRGPFAGVDDQEERRFTDLGHSVGRLARIVKEWTMSADAIHAAMCRK